MTTLAALACCASRGHEFAEGFNHIDWGPIRVMQVFAVVLIGGLYWLCFVGDQTEPGNSRRSRIFSWTLAIVTVPAVIWAHLATLR